MNEGMMEAPRGVCTEPPAPAPGSRFSEGHALGAVQLGYRSVTE